MLTIERTVLPSPEQWDIIIEGMRNPMNSWYKSDSYLDFECFALGEADHKLMTHLAKGGPVHAKYRRMIPVFLTVNAPLYWWKEFDTYKVGTVCNSCSTMHKIHEKEFTLDDFSHEHLTFYEEDGELCRDWLGDLEDLIDDLNLAREKFLETKEKKYWWQMIQLLPSSYNQKRTVMLNYEVLRNMYTYRKAHKLDEWREFCAWIETLPYSGLITGKELSTE